MKELEVSDSLIILFYLTSFFSNFFSIPLPIPKYLSDIGQKHYESHKKMFMDQIKVEPSPHSAPIISFMIISSKQNRLTQSQTVPPSQEAHGRTAAAKSIPLNDPQLPKQHKVKLNPTDKRLRVHSFRSAPGFRVEAQGIKRHLSKR